MRGTRMHTARTEWGGEGANAVLICTVQAAYYLEYTLPRNTGNGNQNLNDRFCFPFPSGTMRDANLILEQ